MSTTDASVATMSQFPDAQQFLAQYNAAAQQMMNSASNFAHGNTLQFTLPGMNTPMRVRFPDYRLPVCEKCKKNYKTRDMCRIRNGHTELPWSPVYICITLENSLLKINENGQTVLNTDLQVPLIVKPQQWQPYCIKKDRAAQYFDSKTPICAACKKKNYTRSFCRDRHKHRSLPWSTVYISLGAMGIDNDGILNTNTTEDETSPSTTTDPVPDSNVPTSTVTDENEVPTAAAAVAAASATMVSDVAVQAAMNAAYGLGVGTAPNAGEDLISAANTVLESDSLLEPVDPSHTFLVKLSAKETFIQWVELDESEVHGYASSNGAYGMSTNRANPMSALNMNMASNPYMNFANSYMSAMGSNPMQMAQFFANMSSSSNGDSNGTSAGTNSGTMDADVQQQYQQYMNWQAQMWYHQQAQMMAGAAGGTEGVEENEAEGAESVVKEELEEGDVKRTKRV